MDILVLRTLQVSVNRRPSQESLYSLKNLTFPQKSFQVAFFLAVSDAVEAQIENSFRRQDNSQVIDNIQEHLASFPEILVFFTAPSLMKSVILPVTEIGTVPATCLQFAVLI